MKSLQARTALFCAALGLQALIGTAPAADVTVTVVDDGLSNVGGDGTTTSTGIEQGGYTPSAYTSGDTSGASYVIGESAILGIYRSKQVTLKHIAILGDGVAASGHAYGLAVAEDFGLDTTIKERYQYDNGTCRGFKLQGCWFGIDPADGSTSAGNAAFTAYRHRDRSGLSATARRPSNLSDPDNEG